MKLSTKIILPIILIFALLILLNGCFPTVPSPGYTPTDIFGKIETPKECCDTSSKAHMPDWVPMVGATVILTDDLGEVTHTTTGAEGKYQFTNVDPGLYVITAICPLNGQYVIKDVAYKVAGSAFDAGIADCQSTALALVVEYLWDIYDKDNNCFGEGTEVYLQVQEVADIYQDLNLTGISLTGIQGIDPEFSELVDEFSELVDLVCFTLESCCAAPVPGWTGGEDVPPGPGPIVVYYDLTMQVSPTDGGSTDPAVGGSPYSYTAGTSVPITATAAVGYEFSHWSANVADPNLASTTVTMDADKAVTAHFEEGEPDTYIITASAGANGAIAPSGAVGVSHGANQSFAITPDTDYHIDDVLVDGSSVGAVTSYTFTNVTADHTIVATFAIDVPCDEYLKSASIKLTWYEPGVTDSSIIKFTTSKVPVLNSTSFNGILGNVAHPSGQITFDVNLTDPYFIGSCILIVTLEADPSVVGTQEPFVVKIYLNGVLFVTVPMDSQGKAGFAVVAFVPSDTVMTNNCGDIMVIDVTDVANVEVQK